LALEDFGIALFNQPIIQTMNNIKTVFNIACLSAIPRRIAITMTMLISMTWSSCAFSQDIIDAAKNGDLEKVTTLVNGNAEIVFRTDDHGATPLHLAAEFGHKDVVELLLAKGAKINAKANYTYEKLQPMESYVPGTVVVPNLQQKVDENNYGVVHDGATPLYLAAINGHEDVVELLYANGADINAKNNSGYSPLQLALENNYEDVAEFLIVKGADVNTNNGYSPLHYAVSHGRLDLVKLLLAKGANDGTALNDALASGQLDVVKLLLSSNIDVNARNKDGDTPLHYAVSKDNKDVVELLLAKGVDVNAKGFFNKTPLHRAVEEGYKDIAELLLAKGADINAKEYIGIGQINGKTPLYLAVEKGDRDMVELLLVKGADVNAKNDYGVTPLHLAVGKDDKNVVELLLANGADVNAKNNAGGTPLTTALHSHNRDQDIVDLLRAHGGHK